MYKGCFKHYASERMYDEYNRASFGFSELSLEYQIGYQSPGMVVYTLLIEAVPTVVEYVTL